jgi:hypothetical protein
MAISYLDEIVTRELRVHVFLKPDPTKSKFLDPKKMELLDGSGRIPSSECDADCSMDEV